MIVGTRIAHHADRADRQEHGEGLPDRVVEAGIADLLEVDGVGLAQDVAPFAGDLARDADGQARPREGMAADEGFREAELAAERPYLVLEQLAQGLDQRHVHRSEERRVGKECRSRWSPSYSTQMYRR